MSWQLKQLEKLSEVDPRLVDQSLDQLLEAVPALREKLTLGAYLDGEINLGKAAELLGIHPLALRQRFLRQGIPVRIGSPSMESLQAEVAAAEQLS